MTLQTGRDCFEFRRNDCRNDSIRKRRKRQEGVEKDMERKDCLHTGCPKIGQRGWAKGFCCVHAHLQNLSNPRKENRNKAEKLKKLKKLKSQILKAKNIMRKLKLKLKVKPKLKLKKAEAARVAARVAMESDFEAEFQSANDGGGEETFTDSEVFRLCREDAERNADVESTVESDAEFRSWSDEAQRTRPGIYAQPLRE